jgi:site-specific DNA-methyltransferase (adenine-specific)
MEDMRAGKNDTTQIFNENCLDTLGRIKSAFIDLMLQDPPYGVTRNAWDKKPDLSIMWPEWERVIKDNGAMIFFPQQPFTSELVMSKPKLFRYDLIWYKPLGSGFLNAKRMPLRNH